jgi:hypothetical protein
MQRVWLIQAGKDAEQIDPMRHAGLIGLPYTEVGNATTLTAEEIEEALIDARRPAFNQVRVQIQSFAGAVKHGDLIVTPNAARREVWLSVVTGGYLFDAEQPRVDGYFHTRTVDWLGWLDRDAPFMKDQLKVIDQPVVLAELYNREWWWKHFDSDQLSVAPRAAWSKAPATRTRTPRATTAKPKPAPKPKAPVPVLCAGACGLQWSPYVLVDGLCPDCRGD